MRRSTTERELIAVPDIWVGQNPETFQLISGQAISGKGYNFL
uniref:WSSV103 n=1 Tax=White spot syndrome virus TaxID=342409 RepID=A0A3G5BI49_9VIRU|nr:wssv150 [White spot syndrome virus]AYV99418.1 WSSV103 [White spot syndrome virus]WOG35218.1 wssv150 [White spot syndrome virus]